MNTIINSIEIFKNHYLNEPRRVDFFKEKQLEWSEVEVTMLNRLNLIYSNTFMITHGFTKLGIKFITNFGFNFDNTEVKSYKMQISACHDNSALYAIKPDTILCTGFALSDDGVWRPHSWVLEKDIIVETTEPREFYFGVKLDTKAKLNLFGFSLNLK